MENFSSLTPAQLLDGILDTYAKLDALEDELEATAKALSQKYYYYLNALLDKLSAEGNQRSEITIKIICLAIGYARAANSPNEVSSEEWRKIEEQKNTLLSLF